jgi:glycerol-3-phosphate dehydrogenase
VFEKLGRPAVPSATETLPVWGGDIDDFRALVSRIAEDGGRAGRPLSGDVANQLARNHGSRYHEVLEPARGRPELSKPYPGTTVLPAQVVHAVRREMAVTLQDVLLRRTDLGTAEAPAEPVLAAVASDMAREAGWDKARTSNEIGAARDFFAHRGATREFDRPPLYADSARAVPVSPAGKEDP